MYLEEASLTSKSPLSARVDSEVKEKSWLCAGCGCENKRDFVIEKVALCFGRSFKELEVSFTCHRRVERE